MASPTDADAAARLLYDFNTEFETATPPQTVIASRLRRLLARGSVRLLLADPGPSGLALVSFRDTIWDSGPAALLEELYVVPELRGCGIGRSLMEATLDLAREAGASWIEVTTGESDTTARRLYERFGFTNLEDSAGHPRMLYYERDLGGDAGQELRRR
jgi:GNAT superfamily N-acetyltransferase